MSIIKRLILGLFLAAPFAVSAAEPDLIACTSDTTNTPNATAAFTPTAGELIVVTSTMTGTVDGTAASLVSSVGGDTYTAVAAAGYPGTIDNWIVFWVANQVATATSQTLSVEPTDVATGTNICVFETSGMSRVGADAVLQISASDNDNSSGATPTMVFPGNVTTTNPTLVGIIITHGGSGTDLAETVGWTDATNTVFHLTPSVGTEVWTRDSGFTGDTITGAGTFGGTGAAVAIELDASALSTPASFVDVTLTDIADGHEIDYEVTGEDATVYAVKCSSADAAPNQAELEAGDCGGGNDAWFAASEAATADVPGDLNLTEANNPVRGTVYVGCAGATGDCDIETFTNEDRLPITGFALACPSSIAGTSELADTAYFDPDFAANDCLEYELLTNESADCAISFEADGDHVYSPTSAGDCEGKRTFNINGYQDESNPTTALFTAPSVGNYTTQDLWCNANSIPVNISEPEDAIVLLIQGEAMTLQDLSALFNDEDGDTLLFTVESGALPNGTSLSGTGNKDWTGTPDTEDEAGEAIVISAQDECQDEDEFEFTVYVTDNEIVAPDCVDGTPTECVTALDAVRPWLFSEDQLIATFGFSDTIASGNIISQDPAAAGTMTAIDPLEVVVSLGAAPPAGAGSRSKGLGSSMRKSPPNGMRSR